MCITEKVSLRRLLSGPYRIGMHSPWLPECTGALLHPWNGNQFARVRRVVLVEGADPCNRIPKVENLGRNRIKFGFFLCECHAGRMNAVRSRMFRLPVRRGEVCALVGGLDGFFRWSSPQKKCAKSAKSAKRGVGSSSLRELSPLFHEGAHFF
jgi:hypothetical protein